MMKTLGKMIHSWLVILWTILAMGVLGSAAIGVSLFSKNGHIPHLLGRIWARSILWVACVKVEMQGIAHIDPAHSYVFMANHQSFFDIPILLGHLPCQFRWLAKKELFKIPLFGQAMRGAGYISIDRSNRSRAIQSLEAAAQKIKNGVSILIFPEGSRSRDGRLRPFKKGGFFLSIDSGASIVPISIHGASEIMPKKTLRIQSGRVKVKVHPPIDSTNFCHETKDDLIKNVRQVFPDRL
jgi:1-acyl-sn-glycerol-3-phosphate acyltransferase